MEKTNLLFHCIWQFSVFIKLLNISSFFFPFLQSLIRATNVVVRDRQRCKFTYARVCISRAVNTRRGRRRRRNTGGPGSRQSSLKIARQAGKRSHGHHCREREREEARRRDREKSIGRKRADSKGRDTVIPGERAKIRLTFKYLRATPF